MIQIIEAVTVWGMLAVFLGLVTAWAFEIGSFVVGGFVSDRGFCQILERQEAETRPILERIMDEDGDTVPLTFVELGALLKHDLISLREPVLFGKRLVVE